MLPIKPKLRNVQYVFKDTVIIRGMSRDDEFHMSQVVVCLPEEEFGSIVFWKDL